MDYSARVTIAHISILFSQLSLVAELVRRGLFYTSHTKCLLLYTISGAAVCLTSW